MSKDDAIASDKTGIFSEEPRQEETERCLHRTGDTTLDELRRQNSSLEQMCTDVRFILGDIERITQKMDHGFKVLKASLKARARENRRFLLSLDAHDRPKRRRRRAH